MATIRSDKIVITSVANNPMVPHSNAWFEYRLYKTGMTLDQFLKAGGSMERFVWDLKRNYIDTSPYIQT